MSDAPQMHEYLTELIGETVYTVVDRKPNTIIDVRGGSVIVATEGNPTGNAVSIALVQGVVDRVFAGQEVIFDPRRRSAFVGAVLDGMDAIEVLTDPRRARLSPTERVAPRAAAPGHSRVAEVGRSYFMYGWDRRWRDYEAQGMGGEPLRHAASNNFERMKTQVGDVVYVVVNRDGHMMLVGRLTVDHVVNQHEAEFRLGMPLYERRAHVLSDAPDTLVDFDREVPEDVARALRSTRGASVAFASDAEYRLSPTALQPMIRLTPESARALDELLQAPEDGATSPREPGRATTSAEFKSAVETHAVQCIARHLEADGWNTQDVGLVESYDLDCTRGNEALHVEVKGTTGLGEAVILTHNEVQHARDEYPEVALAIVSQIVIDVGSGGTLVARGGTIALWFPWDIDDGDLECSVYRYAPPNLA